MNRVLLLPYTALVRFQSWHLVYEFKTLQHRSCKGFASCRPNRYYRRICYYNTGQRFMSLKSSFLMVLEAFYSSAVLSSHQIHVQLTKTLNTTVFNIKNQYLISPKNILIRVGGLIPCHSSHKMIRTYSICGTILYNCTLKRSYVLYGLLSGIIGIFWLLFIIFYWTDTYKTDGAHLWNQYFFVVLRVSSASELTGNSDLILLQQKTVLQTGKTIFLLSLQTQKYSMKREGTLLTLSFLSRPSRSELTLLIYII